VPKRNTARRTRLSTADFVQLAAFRHALRRFLHFSETAAIRSGLTGQQYQALLAIRGGAERRYMTINDLARDLLIKHNSAVGLVDRLVARGLLMRERIPEDRRKVQLRLSWAGEKVLRSLAAVHRQELQRIGPIIHGFLEELARPDKI
jgi:DNA-binding MarR family transcriptional regulator